MGSQRQSKIEMFEDAGGEYRWRLIAPNGKVIADSAEGYSSPAAIRRAVTGVRDAFKFGTKVVGLDD